MPIHNASKLGLFALVCLTPGCIFIVDRADVEDCRPPVPRAERAPAADSIAANHVLAHVELLASDEFEGRAPGTRGEERSVAYITRQFRAIGLEPGNPDGTFVQKVPLVGFRAAPHGSFEAGGKTIELAFPSDCVALSRRFVDAIDVDRLGRRVRRLRRRRARVRLGRLQGRRRPRQDDRDA